jgi:hypothetical protein
VSALFKTPKVPEPTPPVDPAQEENRKAEARLRRMRTGGSQATILSDAMTAARSSSPRATVTGMG